MERRIFRRKKENNDFFLLNGSSNAQGVLMRYESAKRVEKNGNVRVSSSMALPPVYAFVKDNGEISTNPEDGRKIARSKMRSAERDGIKTKELMISLFAAIVTTAIIGIITFFVAENFVRGFNVLGLTAILIGVFASAQYFRDIVSKIKGDEDFISFTKFHAAEHRVINAYNILKRVPKFEELKDFSNHSYYCEYYNETSKAWMWIVVGICMQFMGTGFAWLIVLTTVIATFALEYFGYIPLGMVYVSEPDEIHLKTALTALEEATEIREDAESHLREVAGAMDSMEIVFQMGKDEKGNPVPAGIIINIGCEPDEETDEDSGESKEN